MLRCSRVGSLRYENDSVSRMGLKLKAKKKERKKERSLKEFKRVRYKPWLVAQSKLNIKDTLEEGVEVERGLVQSVSSVEKLKMSAVSACVHYAKQES